MQLLPELNEGGVERGVVELNRELTKLGIESIVISAGGKLAAQIDADGGRHLEFDLASKNPLTAPWRIRQLRRLLGELQPSILHARSRVPAWLIYLANKRLQIPFVTTVHGFNSVNAYSRVMTYGDRVICVSNAIKDYIQNHYQVAADKITVIPRGVDLDFFAPEKVDRQFTEMFKQEFALEGRFVVTSVGRITQLKDYETFIRGVAASKQQIPEICGLIVGGVREDKQDYYASLQQLVAELKAEAYIHFTGSQQRVADIYALSDLVVVASKKPESFGRSAAEALAMNVPVAATAHGGVMDVVLPGKTGYLFPPKNPARLAEAIGQSQQTSWQATRPFITEKFSLAQMVAATVDVYREFVS